jgi:CRP/FNR family cyclic AMP-dependent transcriptional regulator
MKELSNISIFEKLSADEIAKLGSVITRKTYAADQAVVFEGEPSDSLYILMSGSAKVYVTSEEGQERILKMLGPGEIFGELAMLDGHPRSATVATLEPTEMASMSRRDFQDFVANHPAILWKVLEALCERVRKTSAEVIEMSSRDVPYRLLAALSQLAEKHGETAADGSCRINLKLDVGDLTAMVGSNRETVSRLLHQYQEEGLVRLEKKGQIFIPNLKGLARAVEYSSEWS